MLWVGSRGGEGKEEGGVEEKGRRALKLEAGTNMQLDILGKGQSKDVHA